uniref:Gypsy retrotransposon integrase-like protein 1 n=2 Tax=Kryptolebias marmoratus TaxID=37003 RepID=A0A3Q2ZKC0_KRYMA
MRLMRFSYSISHVAGKNIATADVLSRAPIFSQPGGPQEEEINLYVDSVVACLPATEPRLREIQRHQDDDNILKQLKTFCVEGWPDKHSTEKRFQPYLPFSGELTVQNGLLLYGSRIVIPASLRQDILVKLHEGHLGITKCRERAKHSVWWPGLSSELIKLLETCETCCRERTKHKEPLLPTEFPQRPWVMVGADLFQFKDKQYLIVVDYFSRFFEVAKLTSTTSEGVIEHCKSIFARHGIPERFRSDNGPQFASASFRRFARDWGFSRETSSPNFPQSNGEAERAVRTIKTLLKKSGDPYLALMAYHSAPLANGFSPAELLMGRRIRTTVPVTQSQLMPKNIDTEKLRTAENKYRQKQRQNYNRRHRAHNMSPLHPGEEVWVTDLQTRGTVVSGAGSPRSYIIETPRGMLRRNSYHLSHIPGATDTSVVPPETTAVPHKTLPEETSHNYTHTSDPDEDQ